MNNTNYFTRLWNSLLAIFREPENVGKQFIQSRDYLLALGYILFETAFSALLGLIIVARINGSVNSLIGEFVDISLPVGVGFGLGALFYFIEAFFLVVFILVFSKAFNLSNMDFKGAMVVSALQSIFTMPVTLISFIVAAINPGAGLFVFFIGKIWGNIVVSRDVPNQNPQKQEKTSIMVFLSFACTYIVTAIIIALIFVGITVAAVGSLLGGF